MLIINIYQSLAANGARGFTWDTSSHPTIEDAIDARDDWPDSRWRYSHSLQHDPESMETSPCDLDACLREQRQNAREEAQYERGLRAVGGR